MTGVEAGMPTPVMLIVIVGWAVSLVEIIREADFAPVVVGASLRMRLPLCPAASELGARKSLARASGISKNILFLWNPDWTSLVLYGSKHDSDRTTVFPGY